MSLLVSGTPVRVKQIFLRESGRRELNTSVEPKPPQSLIIFQLGATKMQEHARVCSVSYVGVVPARFCGGEGAVITSWLNLGGVSSSCISQCATIGTPSIRDTRWGCLRLEE